jgi:hypothetical protein
MSRMNDRTDKDFHKPFPQRNIGNYDWQEPGLPPVDLNEPPPRKGQRCANCNAFAVIPHPVFGKQTVCRADPPKPIFLSMAQTQTVNAQGERGQFPYIIGSQAPTDPEQGWCREWQWVGPQERDGQ